MPIGHPEIISRGPAQDPVDNACKIQTQCYQCAQMDEDTRYVCNPETTKYSFSMLEDSSNGERSIVCSDPWRDELSGDKKSHCRRAICECDRGLSYRLDT